MEIIRYIIRYVVAGAVGYGFSGGVGHWMTNWVVEWLHVNYGPPREKNCESFPRITGALDRFLYTSAWLTPYKEFIGKRVISGYDVGRFDIFIIGNALCVIFGVLGGVIIKLIIKHWDTIVLIANSFSSGYLDF